MPIKEFILTPGGALPQSLETLFAESFDPKLVAKARVKGARVKLIIMTPWPKPPKKEVVIVDDKFIEKLKEIARDETQLEGEIGKLSGPQILTIGGTLGVPMSKTSKVPSLRAQLLRSIRSEIVWKGIAGQNSASETGSSER
jgi:hypothetical protein